MAQLDRLKKRLAEQRQVTLTHPLDDTVTMVHRPPTPDDDDRNYSGANPRTIEDALPCHAGLLADTVVAVKVDGKDVADHYGMDLAAELGIEWEQGVTTAVDVVRAFYGDAWQTLIVHARRVRNLTAGGVSDPSG